MFPLTAQDVPAGVRRVIPRPVRRIAGRLAAHGIARHVEQQLMALAGGREPIVAGPWLGEVGFELLYWVPFIRWFAVRFGVLIESNYFKGGVAAGDAGTQGVPPKRQPPIKSGSTEGEVPSMK